MTVIADISVPARSFAIGRIFEEFPDAEITLERIVPLQEQANPLFWVSNADSRPIEAKLRDQDDVETVEVLTETDSKSLFEVAIDPDDTGLVQALTEARANILEATGTADHWDFRLRFRSHDDLSSFNVALTDRGIPVTLRQLYNPSEPDDTSSISLEQRETLRLAYDLGYFEVPRRTTLAELADEFDVSDTALSQRMRRGVASLVEHSLLSDDDPNS